MKIRLFIALIATFFTCWLAASYIIQAPAKDYPGLSIDAFETADLQEAPPEQEESLSILAQSN